MNWEYAKRIAEVISTRYSDKLPYTIVRRIELAVETMNELQFLEELYFAVRTLWVQYNIADAELSDLIEKAIKIE
jgi:predicted CoA-binding protein